MSEIKVTVIHLGARRYYILPYLFYKKGMLSSFHTDIYIKNSLLRAIVKQAAKSGIKIFNDLNSRYLPDLKKNKVKDYKWFALLLRFKLKRSPPNERNILKFSMNQDFNRRIMNNGLTDSNLIYTFPGEAFGVFNMIGNRAFKCLDQNSAPHYTEKKLLVEEREMWPNWELTPVHIDKNPYIEQEKQERSMADLIITPSDHVAKILESEGISRNKLRIIPYPTDLNLFPYKIRTNDKKPLKVLFLGRVTLLKGIPYLLEAARRLGPKLIQLRMVGEIDISSSKLVQYKDVATFTGLINRNLINKELDWADILCHPSLTEGQSLATNEALASGLPVICTPNSGSQVKDGIDGTIVSVRNIDALINAFNKYIYNREFLKWQSEQAIANRHRFDVLAYEKKLLTTLHNEFQSFVSNHA